MNEFEGVREMEARAVRSLVRRAIIAIVVLLVGAVAYVFLVH